MALLETATLICGVGANPPSSKTLGRRIEAGARMRARVVRTAAIGVNVVQMVTAVALRAGRDGGGSLHAPSASLSQSGRRGPCDGALLLSYAPASCHLSARRALIPYIRKTP